VGRVARDTRLVVSNQGIQIHGLLHGVPAKLAEPVAETGASHRLTLLINVWVHHVPLSLKPLPRTFVLSAFVSARMLCRGAYDGWRRHNRCKAWTARAASMSELRLDVCGERQVLRAMLHQSQMCPAELGRQLRREEPLARVASGAAFIWSGTLRCSLVSVVSEEVRERVTVPSSSLVTAQAARTDC